MGAPATVSYVSPTNDGVDNAKKKENLFVVTSPWCIVKVDLKHYLVFSTEAIDIRLATIYKFNKGGGKDIRPARCEDVTGTCFEMSGPQAVTVEEMDTRCAKFWDGLVAIKASYTFITESFYDEVLGAKHRTPRKRIEPTPAVDLSAFPVYKVAHLAHLRITAGIRGYTNSTDGGDHGYDIDNMLGIKDVHHNARSDRLHVFPRGGVTLAYALVDTGLKDGDKDPICYVMYAMAVCSIEDRYDRRLGTSLVLRKLSTVFEAWQRNPAEIFPGVSSSLDQKDVEASSVVSVDPVIRNGNKLSFSGVGVMTAAFRENQLHSRDKLFVIKSPFFPAGPLTHTGILAHAFEALDVASKSRGMNRVLDVLNATKFALDVELVESGVPPSWEEVKSAQVVPEEASTQASAETRGMEEAQYHGA